MSTNVVVLNADFTFLSVTSWKNAVCLLIEGKAETLKETEKIVRNADRSVVVKVPMIIRVIKYVRSIFRKSVPFSKKNVFLRDGQVCAYCGLKMENLESCTLDHITPRAQGGETTWENSITSCKPCNNRKADRTPRQAKMKLKFQPYQPTINQYIKEVTKKLGIDKLLKEMSGSA